MWQVACGSIIMWPKQALLDSSSSRSSSNGSSSSRRQPTRTTTTTTATPTPSQAPNRVVACHKPKPPNATTACSNCRTICQRDTRRQHTPPSRPAAHVPSAAARRPLAAVVHGPMESTTWQACGCQAAHGGCHSFRKSTSTIGNDNSQLVRSAPPLGQPKPTATNTSTPRLPPSRAAFVPRQAEARRDETIRLAGARLLRFQLIINVDVG